jgi:hypothetical protein
VETPFGRAEDALGGSATFFTAAASCFCPVQVVGVVGDDFPQAGIDFLASRERRPGRPGDGAGRELPLVGSLQLRPELPRDAGDTSWASSPTSSRTSPKPSATRSGSSSATSIPTLQIDVLDQIRGLARRLRHDELLDRGEARHAARAPPRVDLLLVNDSEARELSGDHNLARAARWIQERGPRYVIIKKGEHGAILFTPTTVFFAPGYPLEEVFDPTGAGDAFAGGLMGARPGGASRTPTCGAR